MSHLDPYDRQRRLREVGDAGQERLLAAHARLGTSDALVEFSYLCRAGVGHVHLDPRIVGAPFPHAETFRSTVTSTFAASAWRALGFLRAELGISP